MYQKITHNVSITVEPIFLKEGSKPEEDVFLWAYYIKIENNQKNAVCLKGRYWRITDSMGHTQETRGEGVVGEQPLIPAGGNYEYASGTTLARPSGMMVGHYEMEDDKGKAFTVDVPAFSLDSPYQKISWH